MYTTSVPPWLIFAAGVFAGACLRLAAGVLLRSTARQIPEDETERWNRLQEEWKDAP